MTNPQEIRNAVLELHAQIDSPDVQQHVIDQVLNSYRPDLLSHPANKLLYSTLLKKNILPEAKWVVIQAYLSNQDTSDPLFQALKKQIEEDHFYAKVVNYFTEESQEQIIASILANSKRYLRKEINLSSLELHKTLTGLFRTRSEKWNALIKYYRDRNNHDLPMFRVINATLLARDLDFDHLTYARRIISTIDFTQPDEERCREAIIYLERISKKDIEIIALIGRCYYAIGQYRSAYAYYTVAAMENRDYICEQSKALHNSLQAGSFHPLFVQAYKDRVTTSSAFFSGQKPLDAEGLDNLVKALQVTSRTTDEVKTRLIGQIVEKYQLDKSLLGASKQSKDVLDKLRSNSALEVKWRLMEFYLLERREGVFINNGKKLFHIINRVLAEEVDKCPPVHMISPAALGRDQ